MKTAYAPDNTRSSVVVVLLLGIAACLVAVLVGLSDKPDVTTIGVAAGSASASTPASDAPVAEAMMAAPDENGENGESTADDAMATQDSAATLSTADPSSSDDTAGAATPTEPTATPEVAAAVAPTPAPSTAPAPAAAGQASDSALAPASGSVEGAFFTRADEDKGATVTRNSITVSFNEDGSGSFTGSLDITYADKTRISLQMSGPLAWSTTTPQVEATVSGSFEIDAPVAGDDVSVDKADLNITSLESGSGSLCATKCFGFTFPPQNRL